MNELQYLYNVCSTSPYGGAIWWPILDTELTRILEAQGYIFTVGDKPAQFPTAEQHENYRDYRAALVSKQEA